MTINMYIFIPPIVRTVEELVEAAGAQHGGINQLRPVGGGDDKHVPSALWRTMPQPHVNG
jgi:hypothetical protein